jgi:hypothetical protein
MGDRKIISLPVYAGSFGSVEQASGHVMCLASRSSKDSSTLACDYCALEDERQALVLAQTIVSGS